MSERIRLEFAGGRWLGARVLEHIAHDHRVGLTDFTLKQDGWWGHESVPVVPSSEAWGETPNLIVSCLTSRIWTRPEIEATRLGIINLHPAPLPTYRGCNSYAHAIINGDTHYATTLHYVDEGIDTGPIVAQDWLAIEPTDTGKTLYERAQAVALNMFKREWERIITAAMIGVEDGIAPADPRVPARPQDAGAARYYRRDSLDAYRTIRREWDADQRDRVRRAMTFPPHPGPVEEPVGAQTTPGGGSTHRSHRAPNS